MRIKNKWTNDVILEIETTIRADLRGANLQEANLQRANLQEASLLGTNLQGADLQEANLRGANLQEANLQRANLQEASLRGANLLGANLLGAELRGAELRGADLRGTNLDMSSFPLWCGSFGMKVDTKFVWQLVAHIGRLNTNKISNKAKKAIKPLEPYYNEFCKYRNDVSKI